MHQPAHRICCLCGQSRHQPAHRTLRLCGRGAFHATQHVFSIHPRLPCRNAQCLHIPFFLVFFFVVISALLSEMQNLRSCPAQCGTVRPAATEVLGVDIRNMGSSRLVRPRNGRPVPCAPITGAANIVAQVRRIVQGPVVRVGSTLVHGKIPQIPYIQTCGTLEYAETGRRFALSRVQIPSVVHLRSFPRRTIINKITITLRRGFHGKIHRTSEGQP